MDLPKKINDYQLTKIIHRANRKRFTVGLYQNQVGQQAFAKQWAGKTKNLARYWLEQEINMYNTLGTALADKKFKQYDNIKIPKVLAVLNRPNRLILLTSRMPGQPLANHPERAIEIYTRINKLVAAIGHEPKIKAPSRSTSYLALAFTVALIKAIIKHPSLTKSILTGGLIFIKQLPSLYRDDNERLIHRDLNPTNVLVDKDTIGLIDLEYIVYAHPLLGTSHLAIRLWDNPQTKNEFIESVLKQILSDHSQTKKYQALSLYTAIIDLSSKHADDPATTKDYLQFHLALT